MKKDNRDFSLSSFQNSIYEKCFWASDVGVVISVTASKSEPGAVESLAELGLDCPLDLMSYFSCNKSGLIIDWAKTGEVIYDNADRDFSEYFDFRLEGTRTLGLKIKVPDQTDSSINPQGCVAILLGRKMKN